MYNAEMIADLEELGIPVYHYAAEKRRMPMGDYIVYSEDEREDLEANGLHIERGTSGTIDLFVRSDSGTLAASVESVFDSYRNIVWRLYSTQYEDDTRYLHYQWRVSQYG